ncbi:MAG TPA: hypothetical protein DCF33_07505 [Saprospirales bacterium]|nr:hypothetical protein [Saprospirales bacterium]
MFSNKSKHPFIECIDGFFSKEHFWDFILDKTCCHGSVNPVFMFVSFFLLLFLDQFLGIFHNQLNEVGIQCIGVVFLPDSLWHFGGEVFDFCSVFIEVIGYFF